MGKLLWLAAYPKSGNTWLRAFLHNLIRPRDEPYDINALNDLSAGEAGTELYRHYDPRPATQYSIADVQRLRPLVHRDLTTVHPETVFVKTHNALMTLLGIPLVTPEVTAGAIYLVRDPRDVAVSYAQHLGRSLDDTIAFMADPAAATGGDEVKVYEHLASWSLHVHFWTRHRNPLLLVLRYEDMLAQPQQAFGGVMRFLGLEYGDAARDRAVAFSAFPVLQEQERRGGFVERSPSGTPFFRTGQAGVWRDVLTREQARRIGRDHEQTMRRFGYL